MNILQETAQNRRIKIINKMSVFGYYPESYLQKLSQTELEKEYKIFLLDRHPHCETGSIHWIHKKAK